MDVLIAVLIIVMIFLLIVLFLIIGMYCNRVVDLCGTIGTILAKMKEEIRKLWG